jgi:hypothetical protein
MMIKWEWEMRRVRRILAKVDVRKWIWIRNLRYREIEIYGNWYGSGNRDRGELIYRGIGI